MAHLPLVSVIMPVYNGEKYVGEAIDSILSQTFRDFELIILNDGSTDGTGAILAGYQQADGRIRVCDEKENRGIIPTRNIGCRLARGQFFAPMDADDVSLPCRLETQVRYLQAHPEIGVLGAQAEKIDENGSLVGRFSIPTEACLTGWTLLFRNCVVHSTVLMRRETVERLGYYSLDSLIEDYDLWARASATTKIANLPETLVRHRTWGGSHSQCCLQEIDDRTIAIMHSLITRLLGEAVPLENVASLWQMLARWPLANAGQIEPLASLIERLLGAYLKANSFSQAEAKKVALDASIKLCQLAVSARRFSLAKSVGLTGRALRLSPQLLPLRLATRGPRMLLRRT